MGQFEDLLFPLSRNWRPWMTQSLWRIAELDLSFARRWKKGGQSRDEYLTLGKDDRVAKLSWELPNEAIQATKQGLGTAIAKAPHTLTRDSRL